MHHSSLSPTSEYPVSGQQATHLRRHPTRLSVGLPVQLCARPPAQPAARLARPAPLPAAHAASRPPLRRTRHLISLAVFAALSGFGLSACATETARLASVQTRAPGKPAPVLSADEAFVQARRFAMAEPSLDRFDQVAERAREVDLLRPYLDYWRLRLQLADPRLTGDPGVDASAERLLAEQSDTIAGDMLRRDWMLNLGRRGEWARFDTLYANWVLRDDNQVECYRIQGAASRGEAVGPLARAQLTGMRDYGEACYSMLDALVRNGVFKREDLRGLLLTALEQNSPGSIRRLGLSMGLDADLLERAIARPALVLAKPLGGDYDLIALVRTARQQSPGQAAARLPELGLNKADTAFAWSQMASASMRRLEPEALTWTRRSLDAPASDETWAWLARAALRDQDWKTLEAVVARMSPALSEDPTWVYWKARALKAGGTPAAQARAEPLLRSIAGQYHFYGQLAAEDLGQLTLAPPRASAPTEAELGQADTNPGLARALKFYDLGLRFEGNREWNFQLRTMNDRQLLAAATWACRQQVLDRCVNTADRTTSEHDFALRFVSPFLKELQPAAAERGLDPAWIYGLIRQESRFIMNARSSAGAQGLMQMMPATARWVARRLGVTDFRVDQLNTLDTNLRFGTYYLRTVYDDLDGSPVLASAAYNAGPGRPRNWRATLPGAVEGAVFAEIIPFSETRDYVKKVLSNTAYYSNLFTGQPQSLRTMLGTVEPKVSTTTSDTP